MTLDQLQRWFWDAVTGPEAARADGVLVGDARLGAEGRLAIYREMYVARIRDALTVDHPALVVALADDFDALVRRFLTAHPSTSPSIARAGDALPTFLDGWHADLARLERARSRVFDAADAEPLTLDDLRSLAPESWPILRLARVPACERLSCGWAVDLFWRDVDLGVRPAVPTPEAVELIVWRLGATTAVAHRRVDPAEHVLLDALDGGATFGDACAQFAARDDEVASIAAPALARLVASGLITRL